MDKNILNSLLNPVRMRIFQFLLLRQQATTAEIAKELGQVPPASLYRHMNQLVKDGILGIYQENKVRGVYEKVYEIKNNPLSAIQEMVDEGDREALYDVCYTFTLSILMDFGSYLKRDQIDLQTDQVGFRSMPLYMSDEESQDFVEKMHLLIKEASQHEASDERKLRKYSYAYMPIEEEVGQ